MAITVRLSYRTIMQLTYMILLLQVGERVGGEVAAAAVVEVCVVWILVWE